MENLISNNIMPLINSKQPALNVNKAKESAESFEAFFLSRMMESMFSLYLHLIFKLAKIQQK